MVLLTVARPYFTFLTINERRTVYNIYFNCIYLINLGIVKRDENGGWRRPNIVNVIKSRKVRWAGHVARMEEGRSAFKILTGKPTRKTSLGRPRRRWEYNIRMNIKEIGINTRN